MEDDQLRQRLTDLGEIAASMNPESADDEIGRARIEAYRAGLRFAVSYIEDDGSDAEVIPFPRN